MASLPCKLVAQVAFKASGNVFHHLFTKKPHHLAKVTPGKIQACDLHQGEYGTNGSIVQWKFTLDGKEQISKQILQDIDEAKKKISFKMIEGELLELYKNILFTFHVETKGGVEFVVFTMEYELLDANNPHPISLLKFVIELINEIEGHILG